MPATTSYSVGAVGTVKYDAVSDRLKGLLTSIATSPEGAGSQLQKYLAPTRPPSSRLTVRLFVTPNVTKEDLDEIHLPWRGGEIRCEAYIPMALNDVGGLVYFGGNAAERGVSTPEEVTKERELLRGVTTRAVNGSRIPEETFEVLDHPAEQDVTDLLAVYDESYSDYIVAFNRGTIMAMCRNNLVVVARSTEGRIVAVSQGEVVNLPDLNLKLVELTETATLPAYRSRGLTTFCKKKIIETVAAPRTQIYAESRANWGGVLRQNHSIGMKIAGRLERHCLISSNSQDIRQTSKYGNLVVFHLPH